MAVDKLVSQVMNVLKKYKILTVVCVFLSFFVVITVLNFVQRATLEGFMTLQQQNKNLERFTTRKHLAENAASINKERFANRRKERFANKKERFRARRRQKMKQN